MRSVWESVPFGSIPSNGDGDAGGVFMGRHRGIQRSRRNRNGVVTSCFSSFIHDSESGIVSHCLLSIANPFSWHSSASVGMYSLEEAVWGSWNVAPTRQRVGVSCEHGDEEKFLDHGGLLEG